jgi:phosphatidylserine decarboxylase
MYLHREGTTIIAITVGICTLLSALVNRFLPDFWGGFFLAVFSAVVFFAIQFFRNPKRTIPKPDNNLVYAPADGKVVVIEETEETEYFKDKRLQISIFMSPFNVHVNRNPIGGTVQYTHYHPGKYLVAWHPKSSVENERTTVVLNNGSTDILLRQIAGAMARRIRNYLQVGQQVTQGSEMGFIRFGSRVDIFLPLDAKVEVQIGQTVRGNLDVLARL